MQPRLSSVGCKVFYGCKVLIMDTDTTHPTQNETLNRSEPNTLPEPDLTNLVDLVDFYMECDAIFHSNEKPLSEMSQKKCRFCS